MNPSDHANSELAKSKLIILSILQRVPAIRLNQLTELALETLYMDYFTFATALDELCRGHMAQVGVRRDEPETDADGKAVQRCDMTRQGQAVLTTLEHQIPLHIRSYLAQRTRAWQKTVRRDQDVHASFDPDANGQFTVHLRQSDGQQEQVDIRLTLPDRHLARKVCLQWESHPQTVYVRLLALLTGESRLAEEQDLLNSLPVSQKEDLQDKKEAEPIPNESAQPYPAQQTMSQLSRLTQPAEHDANIIVPASPELP